MVALHGCQQGRGVVANTFATKTYLNEYADTNGMIVLYPQATASSWLGGNPQGCWNWWGYGGDTAYDMKGGKQIETIMRMVHASAADVSQVEFAAFHPGQKSGELGPSETENRSARRLGITDEHDRIRAADRGARRQFDAFVSGGTAGALSPCEGGTMRRRRH